MEPERESSHWHLDKRLNAGHLITTIALVAGAFTWGSAMDRRIALLEQAAEIKAEQYKSEMAAIRESLARIEGKLDGKADKRAAP